jgi:hypothetical protein
MGRLASIALTLVLALAGMYLGMRIAGPTTRAYNLGKLEYEVTPSWHGNANVVIPHTGLRLEAKLVKAPFDLRVKPTSFSLTGLAQAGLGVRSALQTAKDDIVRGATFAFVRAFLYALAGGLIGVAIAAVLVFFFGRLGTAIVCAVLGVALTVVVVGGSGIWVWRAHYIEALEHPTAVAGGQRAKLNLKPLIRKIRKAHSLEDVVHDLAPVLEQVARG